MQTQSRTAHGLRQFTATEFLGTSNGLATPATNRLVFAALGVSLYATRVTALVWGLAAVPLFWGLVRRLCGGALATFGATLLFVCAPEQLFWSRSEVSVFAPVAALGLLFAHVGLSMVGRFGIAPVLLAACLTPLCRFFYTAGHVLFVYPALLAGHAALFARGVARRALGALPVLLVGVAAWALSVSIAVAAAGGGRRFVDPARVRGEPAWRAGFPSTASTAEVVRSQAARVAANLASVGAGLTYHQPYATHWYERFAVVPARDPMVCVGLTVLAAVGLGYLLGQIAERRAALVLFWLGLGLLPGVLSDEPDARRLSLVFVPLLLLAALVVTAWVRLARDAGGRLAGNLARAGAGLAFAGVSACGLASNLLLPVAPIVRDEQIRFARPLVERSDVVLHNLFYRFGRTLEFGFLDRLLSPAGPCMQFVDRGDELLSLLRPSCDFSEEVYGLTLPPAEIESRRRALRAARVSYLFRDVPPARQAVSVLPAVDPGGARVRTRLALHGGAAPGLRGESRSASRRDVARGVGRRRHGGFLVPKPGWYRLALDPPCPLARVAAGASRWNGEEERPLLPGIFSFEISGPADCVVAGSAAARGLGRRRNLRARLDGARARPSSRDARRRARLVPGLAPRARGPAHGGSDLGLRRGPRGDASTRSSCATRRGRSADTRATGSRRRACARSCRSTRARGPFSSSRRADASPSRSGSSSASTRTSRAGRAGSSRTASAVPTRRFFRTGTSPS